MKFTLTLWEPRKREPIAISALMDATTLMRELELANEAVAEAAIPDGMDPRTHAERLRARLERQRTINQYLDSLCAATIAGQVPRIDDRRQQQHDNNRQPQQQGSQQSQQNGQHNNNNGGQPRR